MKLYGLDDARTYTLCLLTGSPRIDQGAPRFSSSHRCHHPLHGPSCWLIDWCLFCTRQKTRTGTVRIRHPQKSPAHRGACVIWTNGMVYYSWCCSASSPPTRCIFVSVLHECPSQIFLSWYSDYPFLWCAMFFSFPSHRHGTKCWPARLLFPASSIGPGTVSVCTLMADLSNCVQDGWGPYSQYYNVDRHGTTF